MFSVQRTCFLSMDLAFVDSGYCLTFCHQRVISVTFFSVLASLTFLTTFEERGCSSCFFFFPVRIGSTLLIYLRKCFLFFLLLFFPWWRSVHGLFLEMFAVGEQLLLFHYPSMFSWQEMCALGWVALCHWERVAGDRAKIKLQTAIIWITVSTGVFPALCKSLEL